LVRLDLDEVWWLVSPGNPLKPEPAARARRLRQARKATAGERRIKVSDLEAVLGTRYTVDTLALLHCRLPRAKFVWMIGADNLAHIHLWKGWQKIFATVPVAVFARPGYTAAALSGVAARRFARCRVFGGPARRLADLSPPAWAYFFGRLDPESSSRLRAMDLESRIKSG
jgi:nicotinate-nucleotide adenylyltransferase